jgi:hypothetical protein
LRETRKKELDRSMALSRTATASMGKFDKRIEGEAKIKGVKRKVSRWLASSIVPISLYPLLTISPIGY